MIRALSTSLHRTLKSQSATTLAAVVLDNHGMAHIFNAGHGLVAILRDDNEIEFIRSGLGQLPSVSIAKKFTTHTVRLNQNDRIILLSDGVVQGARMQLKMRSHLANLSKDTEDTEVAQILLNFQPNIVDDRTVVIIRMRHASNSLLARSAQSSS